MNYQAALDYVWGLVNFETHPPETRAPYTLDRFRDFLSRLGNPEQAILAVHIAGSKGKGSTSAMIEAVLRAAGYRVGFYTSPHLHTPLERIRIGGQMIPEDEFAALVARLRPVAGSLDEVTTFEFLTALGFVYFAEQKVDVAVIEVGLGGRLDATNLVNPLVAVITPISLEHTKVLGGTIEEIALEKAGIIKPGIPVVSAPQTETARAVLLQTAAECNAPIILVGKHWSWTRGVQSAEAQRFSVEFHPSGRPAASANEAALRREAGPDVLFRYVDLAIPLLGLHQLDNATTGIAALELLKQRGFPTSVAALRRALAGVEWPARVELL
ncbi:MAG TPA: Mur ligase family protein, partial [Ardenticatenaceae bacterium]|nr:Mur ligase family protein [Ardenticatenaceae bacterium]